MRIRGLEIDRLYSLRQPIGHPEKAGREEKGDGVHFLDNAEAGIAAACALVGGFILRYALLTTPPEMLAEASKPGEDDIVIPHITQEALASMIGSTRPRVNAFMNRFRKLGYIEYNGQIRVHKSLLNVFLRD